MKYFIWDEQFECMALPQLVERCERRFREAEVMRRAAGSALYRERWAAAGVVPEDVRTYAELKTVPYTTSSQVREAETRHHPDELVCSDHAQLWISTSGTTGAPKWIPASLENLDDLRESLARSEVLVLGKAAEYSVLAVSAPAPFISESLGYHLLLGHLLDDRHVEMTFVSLPEASDGLVFARMAQTEGLSAFPSLAIVIAEGVAKLAADGAAQLFKKERSLRNLLGVIATRVLKIKARHVFKFRWGMFAGEPVDAYRKAIVDSYGLEPSAAYTATEFGGASATECQAHAGLHIYLDLCLPEVIPEAELEKEDAAGSYVPQALPLWESPSGLTGELVLTTFDAAFPLVRYRTSDLIEVVSTDPCACGRTHPRIRVFHRTDDVINLGLIRFSIYLLKDKLEEVTVHGRVARWQARITRENHKPKVLLLVQPAGDVAPDAFVQEIADKLDELEGVRQAWENGLIARPEVRLLDEVVEQRTATGKLKLAVYDDAYFKEG
jgi:phenylacetate-CoA ligase